ncbi:MAG: ABC transporter permease [Candidatus Rokubacteria bacterium]|nr:ABC transporter permease [Candidatus Rokubacteria bacterium]
MLPYVVRRLAQVVPVLLFASLVVFLMVYLVPGDPVLAVLGGEARPEQVEAMRKQMGLDRPLVVQYGRWLGRVAQGDLGVSFINSYPVWSLIGLKLPATLALAAGALTVTLLISLPLGILAAVRQGSWVDRLAVGFTALGLSVPTFWLGVLLVLLFSLRLQWLPASGYVPLFTRPALSLQHLLMPSVTLGIAIAAILTRFVRTAMLEVIRQDYVRTARAKGLPEGRVVIRHALKNAFIPVLTVIALQVGNLLGGAVITESIFDYPGVGQLILYAVTTKDYSVVQGTLLLLVFAFVLINLLTDVAYAILDPRVRYGGD